jgi:hypothetical protein
MRGSPPDNPVFASVFAARATHHALLKAIGAGPNPQDGISICLRQGLPSSLPSLFSVLGVALGAHLSLFADRAGYLTTPSTSPFNRVRLNGHAQPCPKPIGSGLPHKMGATHTLRGLHPALPKDRSNRTGPFSNPSGTTTPLTSNTRSTMTTKNSKADAPASPKEKPKQQPTAPKNFVEWLLEFADDPSPIGDLAHEVIKLKNAGWKGTSILGVKRALGPKYIQKEQAERLLSALNKSQKLYSISRVSSEN